MINTLSTHAQSSLYSITLDTTYKVNESAEPEDYTRDIAVQRDGLVIYVGNYKIGGEFQGIGRANIDGSLDASFNPGISGYDFIEKVSLQADQKILIGGNFAAATSSSGTNHYARLNSDGSPDLAYNSNLGSGFGGYFIGGSNPSIIRGIAIQSDGKAIVVGGFTEFNGMPANHIVRLNTDGTRDFSFNVISGIEGSGFNSDMLISKELGSIDVVVQPDDKILIAGIFTSYNGVSVPNYVLRLNSDGTLDGSFDLGPSVITYNKYSWVNSFCLQEASQDDPGGIIIFGNFDNIYDQPATSIARLKFDGTFDKAFSGDFGETFDIIALKSGHLLVVGAGKNIGGAVLSTTRITILNPNGTIDSDYDFGDGCDKDVNVAALQNDNKILLGGVFKSYDGEEAYSIARLDIPKGSPLPIILSSFTAIDQENQVLLKWETGQEVNSSYFIIERSTDGREFYPIGKVAAHNNLIGAKYTFSDLNPLQGYVFYRLKSVDLDFASVYSNIVVLSSQKKQLKSIELKANLVYDYLPVKVKSDGGQAISYIVVDLNGRTVLSKTLNETSNNSEFKIDISTLSPNLYILKAHIGAQIQSFKFVKQ